MTARRRTRDRRIRKLPWLDDLPLESWRISPRSTVVHRFVRGPGTGDASICGALLGVEASTGTELPTCTLCARLEAHNRPETVDA
jgi:hypothetical protein